MPIFGSVGAAIILLLVQCPSISSLTCMKCDDSPLPSLCRHVMHCGPHEVCSIDAFVTTTGVVRYRQKCTDTQFCSADKRKRLAEDTLMRRDEVVVCSECCTGDLCNAGGCYKEGFAQDRGLVCYSCDVQIGEKSCDKITQCGRDELCHIRPITVQGSPDNLALFRSNCAHASECNHTTDPSIDVFGRRDASKTCNDCCNTDLCNNYDSETSCSQNLTPTSPVTPLTTITEAISTMSSATITVSTPTKPDKTPSPPSTTSSTSSMSSATPTTSLTTPTTTPVPIPSTTVPSTPSAAVCVDLWDHCPSESICVFNTAKICCPKTCHTCESQSSISTSTTPPCITPTTGLTNPQTTTVSPCSDVAAGCESMLREVYCVAEYETWARTHCRKSCGYCT